MGLLFSLRLLYSMASFTAPPQPHTFFHSTTTEKPQQQGNKEYKHKKHSAFYIPPEGAPGISLCSLDHTGVKKIKFIFLLKKIIIFFLSGKIVISQKTRLRSNYKFCSWRSLEDAAIQTLTV